MTLRRSRPLLLALVVVAAVAAAVVAPALGYRTETGIVVDVDAAGLTDVRAFTLRSADGRETTFRLGPLENAAAFPPGHLVEHIATGEPVRVWFRQDGGERVVFRLEDAGG